MDTGGGETPPEEVSGVEETKSTRSWI